MVVVSLLNVAVAAAVIALERMDMALEGTRGNGGFFVPFSVGMV